MSKDHLKRNNAPRTWDIDRKKNVFVTRPSPSGHKFRNSLPLVVLFRDMLKKVKSIKELEYILNNKEVYINSKKVTSPRQAVGLMDVIRIPEIKENYRVLLNSLGVLDYVQIDENEANIIPLMVRNKTKLKSGRTQINFTNGSNMLVDEDVYKTKDVLMYDFMQQKINDHLRFQKGVVVYFTRGRYIGTTATVEEIRENSVVYKKDDNTFETDKSVGIDYTFLVGKESPAIKLAG